MARAFIMTSLMVGVILLLGILGFPTASSSLVNALIGGNWSAGDFSQYGISTAAVALAAIFAISGLVSIGAGLFGVRVSESFVVGSFAGALFLWVSGDLMSIIQIANSSGVDFVSKLITVIIGIAYAGWVITIVQWWRGNDI